MPPGDGTPEDDYPLLVQRAVSGYVRGQLLFSLVMGGSAAICLEILGLIGVFPAGRDYAVFFGAFYGLMEFIPYIGPIVGPIPAVLVALFQDPITAVWLISCSSPSSSWRATWWRPRCSGSRCGSTRSSSSWRC